MKEYKLRYEKRGYEAIDTNVLETFEYEYKGRRIEIIIETDEFTSLCPRTGLPDFAKLRIKYIPKDKIIELKSLKYYLLSYRNVGIFYEHAVNRILEDLVKICDPIEMHIELEYKPRGGIKTTVKASYYSDKHRKEFFKEEEEKKFEKI